ncbi:GTP-binding protein [Xylanibacillus composti]|uniref:Putative glycoside hydrolase n=1 Tax=Xylanibacillus composti TaxID=1572762 RepID=A0A8J4H3W0_9BACL|nr:putative glycoside hydrolase [Xylanibacillus composti]MDT9724958.1 GTP-binding protein [Xylanibacillus composti]GIQ68198.1 putative glycoside hydrolase [Xylanibacillus composti]
MDILLASLLLLMGNVEEAQPDASFEQLIQASLDSKHAIIAQLPEGNAGKPVLDGGSSSISGESGKSDLLVKLDPQREEAPVVRGIYVTAHSAAGARMESLLQLMDDTELNAMVIDVKDDWGNITYPSENPKLQEMGTTTKIIRDIPALMDTLEEHDIYPIARIVVFKDSIIAKKKPEWSFLRPDGTVWDNGKPHNPESFVNPYLQEVWDYNIEVAKEAAALGFKEIQFDYVRFPEGFETRADKLTYYQDERSRIEAVADFVQYAREELAPLGVRVSVDIFGYAASVPAAEGIGQDFNKISQYVDVICPMVYPSHYSTGWFGQKVPDASPYEVIYGAMADTHTKLEEIGELKPIIRPWIQDFTASWVPGYIPYGKKEVEAQIRAMQEQGIDEFLLWNASNRYTAGVDYDLDPET